MSVSAEERNQWKARHKESATDRIQFGDSLEVIKKAYARIEKLYAFPERWFELEEQMYIIANAATEAATHAKAEGERKATEN
jgi:hypothetical protein